MFEILKIKKPTFTMAEHFYLYYKEGDLFIKTEFDDWYEATVSNFVSDLEWIKVNIGDFEDDVDSMEELIEISDMKNLTEEVTIQDAVEVWFDAWDDEDYF